MGMGFALLLEKQESNLFLGSSVWHALMVTYIETIARARR